MTDAARLTEILRADPALWRALCEARAFALPDWWIVSGAVYNTVWNHLTGKPPGYGIKDIDLFYFDSDTSWEAEDAIIRRGARHFSADPPVEIRNQSRVHLWYAQHFGRPIAPLRNIMESLDNFACETHAVAVRLTAQDRVEIAAPFGLDAIFARRLVPNLRQMNRATHEAKAERQCALWPGLTVEPWPETAIMPANRHTDWSAVHALLVRAFAFMDGRIDPPSSLRRMAPGDLADKSGTEACFIAHDGTVPTGCIFCKFENDLVYVGKMAVNPDNQGRGIGRMLMARAEAEALHRGTPVLELQTRIELTENHAAFAAMGFRKTGETSHAGYDRPTSITMRKVLK